MNTLLSVIQEKEKFCEENIARLSIEVSETTLSAKKERLEDESKKFQGALSLFAELKNFANSKNSSITETDFPSKEALEMINGLVYVSEKQFEDIQKKYLSETDLETKAFYNSAMAKQIPEMKKLKFARRELNQLVENKTEI